MPLKTKITARVEAAYTSALDLAETSSPLDLTKLLTLATGTGAGQADQLFHDRRTLAASASENLDLAASLVNAFGATLTFARVKALLVLAAAGNTNNVNVTSPGSNGVPGLFLALGDGVVVRPGGLFLWATPDSGAVVTAATGDLLTVANSSSGTSVTYDVVVVGASA